MNPPPTWRQRLEATRKLLFRADPYILISKKPADMLRPRGPEHRFDALGALIERDLAESPLLARLAPALALPIALSEPPTDYFSGADARVLDALVRTLKPARVIEVGSGTSTRLMRAAARAAGHAMHILCIDPEPRSDIRAVADEIVNVNVVACDPAVFAGLRAGDLFFLDGSHYAFNGTDVPYLLLEILPRLPAGVIVHVHDICLPYEYSALFTARSYNEQYVLAGLLLGGALLRVDIPVYALWRQGKMDEGYSFWMTRR